LSPAEGRKFGLTVGLAFLLLAAVVAWRGRSMVAGVFGVAGGVLFLSGLLVPGHLGPVQAAWMRFAHAISKVTTPIVMGIAYFVIITPIALVRRGVGKGLRSQPHREGGFWVVDRGSKSTDMHRQF